MTLLSLHSILRWLVLGFAINALWRAARGRSQHAPYTPADRKGALLFVATLHLNFVLGLVMFLWTSSVTQAAFLDFKAAMKIGALRFFVMEHPSLMLLGVIVATVGSARVKRGATDAQKHQRTLVFFGTALALILAGIPWPFYPAGRALLPF